MIAQSYVEIEAIGVFVFLSIIRNHLRKNNAIENIRKIPIPECYLLKHFLVMNNTFLIFTDKTVILRLTFINNNPFH